MFASIKHRVRDESGIAVPLAIFVVSLLVLVGGMALQDAVVTSDASVEDRRAKRALQAADGYLFLKMPEEALGELESIACDEQENPGVLLSRIRVLLHLNGGERLIDYSDVYRLHTTDPKMITFETGDGFLVTHHGSYTLILEKNSAGSARTVAPGQRFFDPK